MALGKKDIFEPTKGKKIKSKPENKKKSEESFKRHTYYLKQSLIDKIENYSYWERYKKSEVVNMALAEFFKDKKIKVKPDKK